MEQYFREQVCTKMAHCTFTEGITEMAALYKSLHLRKLKPPTDPANDLGGELEPDQFDLDSTRNFIIEDEDMDSPFKQPANPFLQQDIAFEDDDELMEDFLQHYKAEGQLNVDTLVEQRAPEKTVASLA